MRWPQYPNPISRMDWPGIIPSPLPPTHSQNLQRRCVCAAVAFTMETWLLRHGFPLIRLDDLELYSRLADPAQGGTEPGYVTEEIRVNGILGSDDGPYTAEWWNCSIGKGKTERASFDLAYSATLQKEVGIATLQWHKGNRVGPDGWLLLGPSFFDPDGHCVSVVGNATRLVKGVPEFGLMCVQNQGSFSPKTKQVVIVPESQFATGSFFVCKSVTLTS